MPRCPACRVEVKPRKHNAAFPFCSPRCRAVDLGRWFMGSYRVPGEAVGREAAAESEEGMDPGEARYAPGRSRAGRE